MTTAAPAARQTTPRGGPVAHPILRFLLGANLIGQCLIVLTGGLVRLTGSGMGCSTWPGCEPGQFVPVAPESYHPLVEFTNRGVGILLGLVAIGSFLAAWRWARRRPQVLPLTAGIAIGTGLQGGIGAISVNTHLDPYVVLTHFLLSMVLVALSTAVVLRVREGDGAPERLVPGLVRGLALAVAGVFSVVLVLGTLVTGSGPHSGDAETPARLGLDVRTISWLHADSVMLYSGLLVAMMIALALLRRTEPRLGRALRAWWLVVGLTAAQGVVGYTQYALGVPILLVALHMVLATLITLAITRALLALRVRA